MMEKSRFSLHFFLLHLFVAGLLCVLLVVIYLFIFAFVFFLMGKGHPVIKSVRSVCFVLLGRLLARWYVRTCLFK